MGSPPTDSKLTIRLHESLKRKDAAMLRAWNLLRTIDAWAETPLRALISDAQIILRQELGPDAYAESIRLENKDA